MEYTGWTWGCMQGLGAFQSHGIALFRGVFFSFTPCLMTVTEQSRGALLLPLGSLGVPSAQVSSVLTVTIRASPGAGKCSGKGEEHQHSPGVCVTNSIWPHWIHTGTQLCCHQFVCPCSTCPCVCPRDGRYSTARLCASG